MVFHFVLDTKGLIFLLFIPSKAGVAQQRQRSSSSVAQCKEEETQPAVSPNQTVELVRKAFFCATKNAQIETKAKVTILCVKQNIKLEGRAKSNKYFQ